MRLERIQLRDFRGVGESDVHFNPTGVTIVEGQNEAGKTSLVDAFRLLIDFKHGSRAAEVRAVQPVGRDVGPFVQAVFTLGRQRLTYSKSWLVGARTELKVEGDSTEQLTGDAAHERVRELLDQHADMNLFRDLWYRQGAQITQTAAGSSPTLLQALESADLDQIDAESIRISRAGQQPARPQEQGNAQDALLERVRVERARYWTDTGRPLKEREVRRAALAQAQAEVSALEQQIDGLDDLAARYQRLEVEIQKLQDASAGHEDALKAAQEQVNSLAVLGAAVERTRIEHQLTQASLAQATQALDILRERTARRDRFAHQLEQLNAEASRTHQAHERASAALQSANQQVEDLTGLVHQAENAVRQASRAAELSEARDALTKLRERSQEVKQADDVIARAAGRIGEILVTAELADRIEAAERDFAVAKARAESVATRVTIRALTDTAVTLGEQRSGLRAGEQIDQALAALTQIRIADTAVVTFEPAAQTTAPQRAVETAQAQLAGLLARAGCPTASMAREQLRERERAELTRQQAISNRKLALGRLDGAELPALITAAEDHVRRLELEVQNANGDRSELAHGAHLGLAQTELESLQIKLASAQQTRDEAKEALRQHDQSAAERRSASERVSGELEQAQAELAEATADRDGEAAEDQLRQAAAAESDARTKLEAAAAELERADPQSAELLLRNAQSALDRHRTELGGRKTERAQVAALLDQDGHSGLAERVDEAKATAGALATELGSEDRRADAARLLYRKLVEQRRAAYVAFAQPLRERLNQYARLVWGRDAQVQIDPQTLQIVSRTLDGDTVAIEQLSGGAREQAAIISRLAIAAIIGQAEADGTHAGVPVVIDDALGYSDQARLARLGAVFSAASEHSQVIVLTCMPERYSAVGNARTVRLP